MAAHREGRASVEASRDTRRLYHSRAARDDRDGALPLQGDTKRRTARSGRKQGGTVEYIASPLTSHQG